MKANVKRIIPLLLVIVMCLVALPGMVYAASSDPTLIDTIKKGSITVTKYATTDSSKQGTPATGLEVTSTPTGYTPLNGATFKLFQIADADEVMAYYSGENDTEYKLALFEYNRETKKATYKYNGIDASDLSLVGEKTTSNDGTCKFDNLEVGIYALVEDTAPNQITTPLAEDSLISIPMVNTQYIGGGGSNNNGNAAWMYDIYVYPKNHEATGIVELTKQDQKRTVLANVVFKLYKKEFMSDGELTTADWTEVTTTTDNSGASTSLTLRTGADGKINLANLPANLYGTQYKLVEVYESGTSPEGYIINSSPLYFKVNSNNTISWNSTTGEKGDCNNTNKGVIGTPTVTTGPKLSITLCNELPSLTKKVFKNGTEFTDANNLATNWVKDMEYRLDDTITYSLIAYVPKNVSEITYEIEDIPELGVDDSSNWDQYTVTYADSEAALTDGFPDTSLTYPTEYSLSANSGAGKGNGFKLTLISDGKTKTAGKFIQIVYKAHMNKDAVVAGEGNGNTATLTYSKFISGARDTYTIKDEARVYTYQYQITKYKDSVDDPNKIGNVEFNLLYAENGTAVNVCKEADGEYRLALTGETGANIITTLTTKADGTILIKGLENGTYYLKEIKTINGYNLLSKPFKIDLNVTETTTWTPEGTFTSTGKIVKNYQSTSYNVPDAKGTSTIINKKGFVLPQTGGMGYLLFCVAGIVLIGGGAMLIFGGRKKKIR